jgi:hypothetical protein
VKAGFFPEFEPSRPRIRNESLDRGRTLTEDQYGTSQEYRLFDAMGYENGGKALLLP